MYGILVSALNFILGFALRGIVVKFLIAFALFYGVVLIAENLIEFLPNISVVASAMNGVPPGVWWFLDVFQVGQGIPMVVAAYVSRFTIRRLPLIG